MFGFFKKKDKHAPLIAAVRGIMANDALIENRRPMSPDALKHNFKRRFNSIEEVEAENMVSDERLGSKPVPFGFSHGLWRQLLSKMQPGDELWTFSTSEESWANMSGRAGISLVRNGKEVDCIIGKMN